MSKRGRPSKFNEDFKRQVEHLCKLGATDVDLAEFFQVTTATIHNWKKKHPDFFSALKDGKDVVDDKVEASLLNRALGYSHPEEKIFNANGEILRATTMKHWPPDVAACYIWLKNRRPAEWREKPEGSEAGESIADSLKEIADKLPV